MNILIILYTLCNVPMYYTVVDERKLYLIEASPENTVGLYEKYKDSPMEFAKLPLDKLGKKDCS